MKLYKFPESGIPDKSIGWAVVAGFFENKWAFVKHRDRNTFELPGGTRETGESILSCAKRELYEETGTLKVNLTSLEVYSIKHPDHSVSYGQLFFANIVELGPLPESEIEAVLFRNSLPEDLTYPHVHTTLFQRAQTYYNCLEAAVNT